MLDFWKSPARLDNGGDNKSGSRLGLKRNPRTSSPVRAPQDPSGFPPTGVILAKTTREDFSYAHASRTAALLGLWTRIMGLLLRPLAKTKPP